MDLDSVSTEVVTEAMEMEHGEGEGGVRAGPLQHMHVRHGRRRGPHEENSKPVENPKNAGHGNRRQEGFRMDPAL
jgi:hypothetical protein